MTDLSHDERTTGRLRELPPKAAELLREALAFTAELEGRERQPADWGKESALYGAALDEVSFPKHVPPPAFSKRTIAPARELAGAARVVAEILAYVSGPDLQRWQLPASAWVRRQWLGLDPPGPLFATTIDGEPVYFAARSAAARGGTDAQAMLAKLPAVSRIAVLTDFKLAALDFWEGFVSDMLPGATAEVGAEAGSWAAGFADRLLALFDPKMPMTERGNARAIPQELSRAAFTCLVRAGVPIEPRWDALLTLGRGLPAAETTAVIAAIPETRRPAALRGALERVMFTSDAVAIAMDLLPEHPHEPIAGFVLDHLEDTSKPKQVLAALKKLGKKSPEVARALAAHAAENDGIAALRLADVLDPVTLDALDATARTQLELANERYGGNKVAVEALFQEDDAEEQVMPSLTRRYRVIDEGGAPRYDIWEYMGDSGTIFEAGKANVVAEIIQGGLECEDRKLKLALNEVIARARAARKKRKKDK